MGRFLGITGTPGTGKKTLAPKVAVQLGLPCIGLNQLLTGGELTEPERGVDPRKLRKRLMKRHDRRAVVFGHMVPDVLEKRDLEKVVVLRCEPSVLGRRLRRRGYTEEKVAANVEAELIGFVSAGCISKYGRGKMAEFDTTDRLIRGSAKAVARLLGSPESKGKLIDWVPLYSSAVKLRSLLSDASTDSAFT
ncbi:MAG: AAA family ATPase [Nitrososphaerota archaeon]|nr:AAA family ATPase [Nitrososphaerota archaeon]